MPRLIPSRTNILDRPQALAASACNHTRNLNRVARGNLFLCDDDLPKRNVLEALRFICDLLAALPLLHFRKVPPPVLRLSPPSVELREFSFVVVGLRHLFGLADVIGGFADCYAMIGTPDVRPMAFNFTPQL